MIIFLDLDGVIRDFSAGLIDHFDMDYTTEDICSWGYSIDKVREKYGFSFLEFWENLPEEFWANIPKTPEADEVLEIVKPLNPIIFTSPGYPHGASGTYEWILRNLPDYKKRWIIGTNKALLAGPHTRPNLLIDDYDKNAQQFFGAGGDIILFPRPWNSLHSLSDDPIGELKDGLEKRRLI
jgi:hypothetical protein